MSDLGDGAERLAAKLNELALDFDFVLIDAGSGLGPGAGFWRRQSTRSSSSARPSRPRWPTLTRRSAGFTSCGISRLRVLVNQAASRAEASRGPRWDRELQPPVQGAVVSPLGPGSFGPIPTCRWRSASRRPFVTAFPAAAASRGVRRIARGLCWNGIRPPERSERVSGGARGAIRAFTRWRTIVARCRGSQGEPARLFRKLFGRQPRRVLGWARSAKLNRRGGRSGRFFGLL